MSKERKKRKKCLITTLATKIAVRRFLRLNYPQLACLRRAWPLHIRKVIPGDVINLCLSITEFCISSPCLNTGKCSEHSCCRQHVPNAGRQSCQAFPTVHLYKQKPTSVRNLAIELERRRIYVTLLW